MIQPFPVGYTFPYPSGRTYDALEGLSGRAREAEAIRLEASAAAGGLPIRVYLCQKAAAKEMQQTGKLSADIKTALIGAIACAKWSGASYTDQVLSTPGLGYDTPKEKRRIDAILDHTEKDRDAAVRAAMRYHQEEITKNA